MQLIILLNKKSKSSIRYSSFVFTGAVGPLTTSASVGIAIASTAVVIFITGFLAGVLVYHCISKHRSQSSKPESTSYQQPQAVSSSSPPPQASPEYEKVIELEENMAYRPKTDWY